MTIHLMKIRHCEKPETVATLTIVDVAPNVTRREIEDHYTQFARLFMRHLGADVVAVVGE